MRTGGASQFHRATVSVRAPNLATQPFCFVSIREIDSTVSQLHSPFLGGVGGMGGCLDPRPLRGFATDADRHGAGHVFGHGWSTRFWRFRLGSSIVRH